MQKLLKLTIYFEDGLYRNFFVVFSDLDPYKLLKSWKEIIYY
jgi:hypothetical protein